MAAKFEVYNDKVGKFRFRVKTGNGTRAAMRDSVCLTASMLIGNGHDDRGQYRQCCRIERRGFDPAGAFENCLLRGHFLGPDQGAVSRTNARAAPVRRRSLTHLISDVEGTA
jgi:hypothetical protein